MRSAGKLVAVAVGLALAGGTVAALVLTGTCDPLPRAVDGVTGLPAALESESATRRSSPSQSRALGAAALAAQRTAARSFLEAFGTGRFDAAAALAIQDAWQDLSADALRSYRETAEMTHGAWKRCSMTRETAKTAASRRSVRFETNCEFASGERTVVLTLAQLRDGRYAVRSLTIDGIPRPEGRPPAPRDQDRDLTRRFADALHDGKVADAMAMTGPLFRLRWTAMDLTESAASWPSRIGKPPEGDRYHTLFTGPEPNGDTGARSDTIRFTHSMGTVSIRVEAAPRRDGTWVVTDCAVTVEGD